MQALDCPFCAHANPAGAKFCNECGSPLHFAPCRSCDAINRVGDELCHRCGAPLTSRASAAYEDSAPPPVGLDEQARWVEVELRRFGDASASGPAPIEHEIRADDAIEPEPEHTVAEPEPHRDSEVASDAYAGVRRETVLPYKELRIPEARSLSSEITDRPSRWRELGAGVAALLVVLTVVAAGYRHYAETLLPRAPEEPRATIDAPSRPEFTGPAPSATTVPAVADSAPLVKDLPPPAPAESLPIPAPFRPEVAHTSDAAVKPLPEPVPPVKLAPACPPAVAALSLCDWVAHAAPR